MTDSTTDFTQGYRDAAQQLLNSVGIAMQDFADTIAALLREHRASQMADGHSALAPAGAPSGHAAPRPAAALSADLDVSSLPPKAASAATSMPAASAPSASFSGGGGNRRVIVTDEATIRRWAGERGLIMDKLDLGAVNAKADHLGLPRFALQAWRPHRA